VSAVSNVDAATNIVLGKHKSLVQGTHCTIVLTMQRLSNNWTAEADLQFQALETRIEEAFHVVHYCTPSSEHRLLA
jgi:hypothetical protein